MVPPADAPPQHTASARIWSKITQTSLFASIRTSSSLTLVLTEAPVAGPPLCPGRILWWSHTSWSLNNVSNVWLDCLCPQISC